MTTTVQANPGSVRAQCEVIMMAALDQMMKVQETALRGSLFGSVNGAAPVPSPVAPSAVAAPSVPAAKTNGAAKAKASAAKAKANGATPGAKRDESEIEAIKAAFLSYVKTNPGQGIEQIAKGINRSTKELSLPKTKLIEAKLVQAMGEKRSTKYFPLGN